MARGDLAEAEYMARRALGLLLTRTSSSPEGDISVSFQPRAGQPEGDVGVDLSRCPRLRWVLYLLSSWLSLRGLLSGVVPFLEDRYTWVETEPGSESEATPGAHKIDWPATMARLASGAGGAVLRSRKRVREETSSRYIALVLAEIAIHARVLLARFEAMVPALGGPLAGMLEDLGEWSSRIEALLESERFRSFRPRGSIRGQIRELYTASLDGEGQDPLYGYYREQSERLIWGRPRQCAVNQVTGRIHAWREQYLAGQVWLADKAGLDLSVGRLDGLYELWCFAEMAVCLQELGIERVVQSSFLRRGSYEAIFELGSSCYAYYDFGAHAFKNVSSDLLFRGARSSAPVLPGARVEWLIRDSADFRNSLILDTKYHGKWDSGEALKVLGYMQNFGVRQGAIVFPCDLHALRARCEPLRDGLFRLPCPAGDGAIFWVLQMVPDAAFQAANTAIMRRFVAEALPGGDGPGRSP